MLNAVDYKTVKIGWHMYQEYISWTLNTQPIRYNLYVTIYNQLMLCCTGRSCRGVSTVDWFDYSESPDLMCTALQVTVGGGSFDILTCQNYQIITWGICTFTMESRHNIATVLHLSILWWALIIAVNNYNLWISHSD